MIGSTTNVINLYAVWTVKVYQLEGQCIWCIACKTVDWQWSLTEAPPSDFSWTLCHCVTLCNVPFYLHCQINKNFSEWANPIILPYKTWRKRYIWLGKTGGLLQLIQIFRLKALTTFMVRRARVTALTCLKLISTESTTQQVNVIALSLLFAGLGFMEAHA